MMYCLENYQMNTDNQKLQDMAEGLIPIFRQTFSTYEVVNSIRRYLGLQVFVQHPLESSFLKKEFGKNIGIVSYFSFESIDGKQKLIFIDELLKRYVYIYLLRDEEVYQYIKKGAAAISHEWIKNSEGKMILSMAKDFFQKRMRDELKLVKESEIPFVFK